MMHFHQDKVEAASDDAANVRDDPGDPEEVVIWGECLLTKASNEGEKATE